MSSILLLLMSISTTLFLGAICVFVSADAIHGYDMYFSVPASLYSGLLTLSLIWVTVGLLTGRFNKCER